MSLTVLQLRTLKPRSKVYRVADSNGLCIEVNPAGGLYWRYRYRFNGTPKMLSLGTYPGVKLEEARNARNDARARLNAGFDPSSEKREEKAARGEELANTFEVVAREWLSKQSLSPATLTKALWMFESLTFPWIGNRPVTDIRSPELLSVLRLIEVRGKLETAQRVKQQCGRVFRYAIAIGLADQDPSASLRGVMATPKTKHRASITEPKKVGELMRAIDSFGGSFVVSSALKLAPLTFVRPGELRQAEWTEIDFQASVWRLPAHKMKMKRDHIVPLSRQAIGILSEIQPLTGRGIYVFPGARTVKSPMSEAAITAALRRMGYSGEEMSGHGFRAMARTLLAEEKGWPSDVIERQLAHKASGPLGAAYDRTQYLTDRKRMMQDWADYLDALKKNSKALIRK